MDFDDLDGAEDDAGGITYESNWKEDEEKKRQEEAEEARKKAVEEKAKLEAKLEANRALRSAPPPLPMDFSVVEKGVPTGPETEKLKSMLGEVAPVDVEVPLPQGAFFGKDRKMKMLFLHGGGTNATISNMQINATFREWPDRKTTTEWTVFEGPHKVPLGWNGDFSLGPFGPDFWVYFERWPFANCQWESWEGIDVSLKKLKEHLKQNGPYDGCVGFDEGGELLVHAVRKGMEGDEGFKGFTRFLMLFTSGSSKHMSDLGQQRPKCQIRIPTFLSWCPGDPAHPNMWYEETALFFHRDYREVVLHWDGHVPPKPVKDSSEHERMMGFIEAMKHPETPFKPSSHEDNQWGRHLFLPIRSLPAPAPPSGFRKRLVVVRDPMRHEEVAARAVHLEELKKTGMLPEQDGKKWIHAGSPKDPLGQLKLKLEVYRLTADKFPGAEGVTFTAAQEAFNWHVDQSKIPMQTGTLNTEDLIDDESHETRVNEWADSLVDGLAVQDADHIALVGLGTGSWIALAMAKMLIRKQGRAPAGLWVVIPPTKLPVASTRVPGMLLSCPVRMLVNQYSVCGPGWRYETATCGKFSLDVFKNVDQLVKMITDEYKAI